jgi:hypothetical protein
MNNNKSIQFRLLGIKEMEFYFLNPIGSFNQDSLEAKVRLNYKWNLEENLFAAVIDFSYTSPHQDENKEYLKLSLMTEFFVENLKHRLIVRTNEDFDIDEILETTIVSITISTTRGVLYEKTKGTVFGNFIMPLIDPGGVILSKKLKTQ